MARVDGYIHTDIYVLMNAHVYQCISIKYIYICTCIKKNEYIYIYICLNMIYDTTKLIFMMFIYIDIGVKGIHHLMWKTMP